LVILAHWKLYSSPYVSTTTRRKISSKEIKCSTEPWTTVNNRKDVQISQAVAAGVEYLPTTSFIKF
jgi:hypothetical protein